MKRWKRKAVSVLAFIIAASLSAQLLVLLPGPNNFGKSRRYRTVLEEDHINLAPPGPTKDSKDHRPKFDVKKEFDTIIIPLKSSHPSQNAKVGAQNEYGANSPIKIEEHTLQRSNAERSKSTKDSGQMEQKFSNLVERDKSLPSPSPFKKVGDSIPTPMADLVKKLGTKKPTESKAEQSKYLSKTKSRGGLHSVESTLSQESSQGKVGNKTTTKQSVSTKPHYRRQREFKKWIILDGLHQPCTDVSVYTSGWADWQVVLVNNGQTPVIGCKPETCQIHQGTGLNKAYLKVITSGADVIVMADCLARYPNLDRDFRVKDVYQYGMYYNSTKLFNPYEYAGYEAVFPKYANLWEHPMNGTADWSKPLNISEHNSEMFFISDFGRVSFRQGFRLGEDICACEFASTFNASTEEVLDNPVVIGDNTLVMLDTGPSLVLPDAFYWLFVPPGLSQNAVHYYRTFWIHALKRAGLIHTGLFRTTAIINRVGGEESKLPKDCVDTKSLKSSLSVVESKQDGYNFTATFKAAFYCIQHTTCKSHMDELTCAVHLSLGVMKCLDLSGCEKSYPQEHIKTLKAWFKELTDINVPLPNPRPLRVAEQTKNTFKIKYNLPRQHLYRSFRHNTTAKMQELQQIKKAVVDPMLQKCPNISHFRFPNSWGPQYIKNSDIALVVTVNYEFLFQTIPHVEFLHRQSFRFIVYCGPNMADFTDFVKEHGGLDHVTFIDGGWSGSNGWHTIYRCLTLTMKMRLPVKGYLQVGEDVLINSRNVASLPRDKVWILSHYSMRNVNVAEDTGKWYHWSKPWGRQALLNLFTQLQTSVNFVPSLANEKDKEVEKQNTFGENAYGEDTSWDFPSPVPGRSPRNVKRAASRFLKIYAANLGGLDTVVNRATDFFYVPETWREDYIILAEIFQYTGVLVEFAFPMLHMGMTLKKNVNYVRGASLWREDRNTPWKFYHESQAFLHPFKSMSNLEHKDGLRFFCDSFLSDYEVWVHRTGGVS